VKFILKSGYGDEFPIDVDEFDADNRLEMSTIPYAELRSLMKIREKKRYTTFLVFQSGIVIMSGKGTLYMKNVYREFSDILFSNKSTIEENTN
jgi:hypothetical protein